MSVKLTVTFHSKSKDLIMAAPSHSRFDPVSTAQEIREQISSARRKIGFLCGAGTSIYAGIPGLVQLTGQVSGALSGDDKTCFDRVIAATLPGANLEQVLDYIRLVRELTRSDPAKSVEAITGDAATKLDAAICRGVYKEVAGIATAKLDAHRSLAAWVRRVRREYPLEVFTTNYDLLFESAFEQMGVPFFDGFVGAVAPFFVLESVEAESGTQFEDVYPPRSWARLWKLHGSVGWQLRKNSSGGSDIVRIAGGADPDVSAQLVIYPSRDKYVDSRKLPFIAYMDRFRRFLTTGEALLIVLGYSFGDQHINDVLIQSLRANPRLALSAFMFAEPSSELINFATTYRNLSVFSPRAAILGGDHAGCLLKRTKQPGEEWPFGDEAKSQFVLGDFVHFAKFLDAVSGSPGIVAPSSVAPVAGVTTP